MRQSTECLILSAVLAGCESVAAPIDSANDAPGKSIGSFRAAGQPTIFRFAEDFDFVVPAGELAPTDPRTGFCPFAVRVAGSKRLTIQIFATSASAHNEYRSTLTNLSTGFSIRDDGAWKDVFRFDDPENVTVVGANFHITIPGRGMVGQDAGTITVVNETGEVLFEGGKHDNFRDPQLTCALLAGGA
jgi:hypothetical protein